MKTLVFPLVVSLATASLGTAQGTLVYDQQSSTDETFPGDDSAGGGRIQFYGTIGQSFTPTLNAVGFVRQKLWDINPGNSIGATLVVNLRADAIDGNILGTTDPVAMPDNFAGTINFFFAAAVTVNPGTTYFMETVVQSGDDWGAIEQGNAYSGGIFYGGLQPFSGNDLWFREGIVVPEPTTGVLLVGGAFMFLTMRARERL